MTARTLLAAVITTAEVPLAEQTATAARAGAEIVELRVDRIGDVEAVEQLLRQPRAVPVIVTVRRADEGGAWTGDEEARIATLARLAQLQPEYVDVEYATWREPAVRARVAGPRLIVSHHDLDGTPANLDAVYAELAATPADVIKMVFTAHDATDACRVLALAARRGRERPLIALAMGEAGLVSRVLARKVGAFLTFASLHVGGESAPGQPTIAELRELYRWDAGGPTTRVFGVVGWPVTHSRGPAVHNAALAADGIDAVYVPLPVGPEPEDFAAFMDTITQHGELDIAGLSVTIPHKEHALAWLVDRQQYVTVRAQRYGAVNTLTRRADGAWEGDNTDAAGALAALREVLPEETACDVAVLGAGGVARAIVTALLDQRCHVTIYNRTPERAAALAQELECDWQPWKQRAQYRGDALINCTAVGLWPDVNALPVPEQALRPGTVVFDTIYRPAETRLLRAARERGCVVVSGVEMFIEQAAAQYERWHGRAAARAVLRAALERAGR